MSQAHDIESSGSAIAAIISELMKDVRVLVCQEMALAKDETRYEIGKIIKSVVWFGIAALFAVIGLITIAAVCVLLLFEYTGLPAWACAAIVSVILLGGAWGFTAAGKGIAKSVHAVPLRTVRTIMDDAKCVMEWVRAQFV